MKLYISSYDYDSFATPFEIIAYYKTKLSDRNVLAVTTKESLIGQSYGFGGTDIHKFYLVNRVNENGFATMDNFPIDVHVCIIRDNSISEPNSLKDVQNIAWACLYDNYRDAKEHKIGNS